MNIAKSVLLMAVMLASGAAVAYSSDELEKDCQKPKFTDFTLTEYKATEQIETEPEAEFSFKASAGTSPSTIKLTIKKQALPFTLESNSSFHKVKAKIPAEFTGKFARLNVSAKAAEGDCHDETGWLLKIQDKSPATTEAAAAQAAPSAPATAETVPVVPTTTETVPATPATTEATAATTNVAPPTTEVVPTR